MKYCIGDTVVCINVEEQNLHSNFQAFRCDESEEPQLTIDIVEEPEMTMNIQMKSVCLRELWELICSILRMYS